MRHDGARNMNSVMNLGMKVDVRIKIGGEIIYRVEDILQFEYDCLHRSTEMVHQKAPEFRTSPLNPRLQI